jgi:hypothetical protein
MVRPGFVPASLASKFAVDDDREYYVDANQTRWVGLCHARDLFAALNPSKTIITDKISEDCRALNSF